MCDIGRVIAVEVVELIDLLAPVSRPVRREIVPAPAPVAVPVPVLASPVGAR